MLQVSRASSLKIPKQLDIVENKINSVADNVAIKEAIATSDDLKIETKKLEEEAKALDKELEIINKIPYNSNDLIVMTVVKKLGAYVIAVTEKSPKKFRGVFVNRMQNYCLKTLELLMQANFIKMQDLELKKQRENYQKYAIINLKLLGYISMVALNSNCILTKQYKQISKQITEAINLISAWKKSDDKRFNKGF